MIIADLTLGMEKLFITVPMVGVISMHGELHIILIHQVDEYCSS